MGRYRAYGLVIHSEIEIPELPDVSHAMEPGDVTIRVGRVPDHLDSPHTSLPSHELAEGCLLLRIKDVGQYLVTDGREIVIDPLTTASEHDVRVFLLGSCFGALLHQRGLLVLHASGFATERGAVLLAGESGAGKSTLLGEFLRRGYPMVVDDVCAVTFDGQDHPIVLPSYPRTRMWSDTADHLGIDTTGLQRTRSHMSKYERQLPHQFWDGESPIRGIYHLLGAVGHELSIQPVETLAAMPTLLANTYRRSLLDGLGMRRRHFDLISALARNTTISAVARPPDSFHLREMADMITDDLESH